MSDKKEIPKHWEIKALGDVLDIQGGSQPAKSNFIYEPRQGYIQLLQIRDFGKRGVPTYVPEKLVTKFCKKDDILIARYGASLGRIVTGLEGAYNVALAKIIDTNGSFDKRFVFYLFKTQIFQTPLAMLSRSAQNGFSKGEIAGIELPIPPLKEQQAIVSKIEELLSDVENGKQQLLTAREQLKVYRQSLLKWAFEGKLTEDWRKAEVQIRSRPGQKNGINSDLGSRVIDPSGTRTKKTTLSKHGSRVRIPTESQQIAAEPNVDYVPEVGLEPSKHSTPLRGTETLTKVPEARFELAHLPEGWKWVKLASVCVIKRGQSKNRPRNEPSLYGGKYPFIQTGDIRNANGGHINSFSQTYSEKGLQQSKLWPKGTLCITIAANIGETAILGLDACFPDSVVGLVCNEKLLLNKYTNYFFISHKSKLEKLAPATAQKNINVDILKKVIIPLPSLEEQRSVIEELESKLTVCDKIEETISNSLQQAETLRQSILKKAFEGKLVKIEEKPAYKPKNVYFYQMQILGYVLKISKQKKISHGEMTTAKYMYLIEKLYGVPTHYKYERWHLGPYPPEMKKAIKNKKFFGVDGTELKVTDEKTLFKYSNPYEQQVADGLNGLTDIFSEYDKKDRAHQTELLATVCKVIEDIKSTDLAAVRQSMKEWKIDLKTTKFKNKWEKFSEQETGGCLKMIIGNGWDSKLIDIIV